MYKVYILQSVHFSNRHYIGYTNDFDRRLNEHNAGKTKSLRRVVPMRLVYFEEYQTQLEAMKREKQIKSYKSGKAFKKLLVLK